MITRKSEVPDYHVFSLGTGDGTKMDEFSEHFQRGGGGSFSIQKFLLQILDLKTGLFRTFPENNLHYNVPKEGRWGWGGQRPFEIFHLFWYRHPSLKLILSLNCKAANKNTVTSQRCR